MSELKGSLKLCELPSLYTAARNGYLILYKVVEGKTVRKCHHYPHKMLASRQVKSLIPHSQMTEKFEERLLLQYKLV